MREFQSWILICWFWARKGKTPTGSRAIFPKFSSPSSYRTRIFMQKHLLLSLVKYSYLASKAFIFFLLCFFYALLTIDNGERRPKRKIFPLKCKIMMAFHSLIRFFFQCFSSPSIASSINASIRNNWNDAGTPTTTRQKKIDWIWINNQTSLSVSCPRTRLKSWSSKMRKKLQPSLAKRRKNLYHRQQATILTTMINSISMITKMSIIITRVSLSTSTKWPTRMPMTWGKFLSEAPVSCCAKQQILNSTRCIYLPRGNLCKRLEGFSPICFSKSCFLRTP